MLNVQYSLKTQLVAFMVLTVCVGILNNRARNQWNAVRQIDAAGGVVYFSTGEPAKGVAPTYASTPNYLPHLYRSICHVTIYPDSQNSINSQLSILTKIPRLASLSIWPDHEGDSKTLKLRSPNGATDDDIEAIGRCFSSFASSQRYVSNVRSRKG